MPPVDELLRPHPRGDDEPGWPPRWMLDLERANDRLRHAAQLLESGAQPDVVDLRPPARAIERVFTAIFDAYDERRTRVDAARDAIDAVDEAVALLAPGATADAAVGFALDYLRETRASLEHAYERLAPLVPRPPGGPAAPDLRASFESPVLHTIDRTSLTPHLRVPAPPPPEVQIVPETFEQPKTFEELEKVTKRLKEMAAAARAPRPRPEKKSPPAPTPDPPLGFAQDVGRAIGEEEFVLRRVRDCFEEISMIGIQRAPLLGDPWRAARILERRMLASIDAIAAMGPPALDALERLVLDAPLKDPPRLFAIAMTLGCIEGRDGLALAERVFASFELDNPEHAVHLGAALKLVPNPYVPIVARTFLGDPDPARRRMAIDVLASRGVATREELAHAASDEPEVAAAALPEWAIAMPARDLSVRDAIDVGLASPVRKLREAARLAVVLTNDLRAASVFVDALAIDGEEGERAAILLAVFGGAREAELLLERMKAKPSRAIVTAVGWAGAATTAVPALLSLLHHDDDAVVLAAAYALDRVTNAGLYEDAIVEADDIVAPDVPDPDVGEKEPPPLARIVSDPRDMPAEPSTEVITRPTIRSDLWRAWWSENAKRFDANVRYRRGFAYTPLVSWRELDLWPCTPGERQFLQWELIARTGHFVRFDINDFVPAQEAAIADWESIARDASGAAGGWDLRSRR